MDAKKYHSPLVLLLIAVLCVNLFNVQRAHADDETPTEPPVPTQVATESPTEPAVAETEPPTEPAVDEAGLSAETPVVETPAPEEFSPVPEEVTETPLAETLSQVPENTEVIVLDENGDSIPLVAQEAAEIMEVTDPMWCPAGALPGDPGCSSSYAKISDLLKDMREHPSFYAAAGVIYFTSSASGPLLLTNQTGSMGAAYDTLKNYDLTLQGGWNGQTGTDFALTGAQTDFASNRITIGMSANPWVGNVTLNDLAFSAGNTILVSVYTLDGDIALNNVDVTGQLSAFAASLTSGSGDITVQNSSFTGNPAAQSRGFSATTSGNISISDTSFTDAGSNPSNGRGYDGATLSSPVVTLTDVLASNNHGDGITINNANVVTLYHVIASDNGTENGIAGLTDNDGSGVFVNGNAGSRLIIVGGQFVNNQEYGIQVGNPASTTIYIQSNPTCIGNDSNASPFNSCYNDTTVFDDTAPVITPAIHGAVEVGGWYGGDVSVTWSYTDGESGILSSDCPAMALTAETAGTVLTCSATNNAGLSNSAAVTIKIDKTGPVVSGSNMAVEATGPGGAVVNYSVAAQDAVDGPVSTNCLPVSGSTFPLGSTTVTCSASDLRGNASSALFLITVNDSTAPSIEPFAGITTIATHLAGGQVFYPNFTTSDLVDGAGLAACSPASGSFFPIGDTRVTCTATDSHGNRATSTFIIHIDYEPVRLTPTSAPTSPVIIIPATGGDLIDLGYQSIFWAFGVRLSFTNLADQQTSIHEIKAEDLPAKLPEGFSFVMGISVDVLSNGKLLRELPKHSKLQLDFPMSGGADDHFAILYWNGSDWIVLAEQKGNSQLPQILSITVEHPGIFVLAKK